MNNYFNQSVTLQNATDSGSIYNMETQHASTLGQEG